jgi:hypothetical protein
MRIQIQCSDLPIWRKIALICCLGAFSHLGPIGAYDDFNIYTSAPDVSTPATGQTYPVHVMHGSLEYVTWKEREEVFFWREKANLAGIPMVVAFLWLWHSSFWPRSARSVNEREKDTTGKECEYQAGLLRLLQSRSTHPLRVAVKTR